MARATAKPPLPLTKKQREVLGERPARTGQMGGKASAAKLTAKQRSEKARKAGKAGGRAAPRREAEGEPTTRNGEFISQNL